MNMNIGFISTWFERGAAYVTKQYSELLSEAGHNIYIYARGEKFAKGDPKWDKPEVTWGKKLYDTNLNVSHVSKWIKCNNLDCIFFNEQRDIKSVIKLKMKFPDIKLGTYIDYYTQNTVKDFKFYDFLICNTKRHYSVFSKYKQCYYIPWGTDINLYTPNKCKEHDKIRFFHSAGMSNRKGTGVLIDAFIEGELYNDSELIIHTQLPLKDLCNCQYDNLEKFNIQIIEKTVSAPGLYYMGDIYVYPTTLDGLGLTMYEALASGMPVITTNYAPMNEVINENVGRLIEVDDFKCRWDAYYWPLAFVNKESLIESMKYYVENKESLNKFKIDARQVAIEHWNWKSRKEEVSNVFTNSKVNKISDIELSNELKNYQKQERKIFFKTLLPFIPNSLQEFIFRNR